jgi:hypothetical protein
VDDGGERENIKGIILIKVVTFPPFLILTPSGGWDERKIWKYNTYMNR